MPEQRYIPDLGRPIGAADQWDRSLVHQQRRAETLVIESFVRSSVSAANYCRKAIELAESTPERERRAICHRRRLILYDAWKKLLIADIKRRLTKNLWKQVMGDSGEFADISRNTAKMVWEEMAVLYKRPASRTTPDKPEVGEAYKKLLRWSLFHPFWQAVEMHLAAFNDLVLWPSTSKRRGDQTVIKHNMAAGDQCSLLFDPELADDEPAVLVFFGEMWRGSHKHNLYTVWMDGWKMVFSDEKDTPRLDDEKLTPISDDDPQGENLYSGPGPFVYLRKNPWHTDPWDQTSGDDLVELTLKIGRRQTDDDYLWTRSCFKQLLAAGNVRDVPKFLQDMSAIVKIRGDNVTTSVIDWQIDFKQRQDVVNGEEMRGGASRGINPERLRRTGYQNPSTTRLAERGLDERRVRMEPIMGLCEDSYFFRVAEMARIEDLELQLDEGVELETTFAPIEYPTEPDKQLKVDDERERRGLQSIVDAILLEHPSWTRERAIEFLERNVEELAQIQKIKQAASVPENSLANRSLEDETNGAIGPVVRDNPASTPTGHGDPIPPPTGE